MEITRNKTGDTLTAAISGRLDTNTSRELQEIFVPAIRGMKQADLDLARARLHFERRTAGIAFFSSVWERAQRFLFSTREMAIDVFRMNGFDKILHIQ